MALSNEAAQDLFKALAKKAGFTEAQVKLALEAEEWKEIQNRDNRHSEYSSALDKLKNLEPKAKKAEEWDEWWTKKGGAKLYETHQQQAQVLARYQERFGELDPNSTQDVRTAAAQTGLTLQQAQAMLEQERQKMGVQFSSMTNDAMAVLVDASNRGLKLSTEDIATMNKIMADKGVTYGAAYAEHFGPKVREMEQQRLAKEKEEYANEKVRDALTRAGVSSVPQEPGIQANFFDRPAAGVAEKSLSDQELLSMWHDSAPGAKSRAA